MSKEVSFRFTRNISSSLTNALILGIFNVSLGCTLDAVVPHKIILKSLLALCHYEFDELNNTEQLGCDIRMKNSKEYALRAYKNSLDLAPIESQFELNINQNNILPGSDKDMIPCDANILELLNFAMSKNFLKNKEMSFVSWL